MKAVCLAILVLADLALPAQTVVLRIPLPAKGDPLVRTVVSYTCDANAKNFDLPPGRFTAEYIHGAGNDLVVVPVNGKRLIFSNVLSADGARFTAGPYEWWNKGDDVTLTTMMSNDDKELSTECHGR